MNKITVETEDKKEVEDTYIPYFQGCDPGVSFISSYDRKVIQALL